MKSSHGFTLIELMYALAVGALVLGIGIPSFIEQVRSSRMNAATNTMLSALYVARSEAVKQRARVTVCRSTIGADPDCDTTGNGYAVFVNQADDITIDDGDVLIRNDLWLRSGVEVVGDGLPNGISYVSTGFTRAVGGGPLAGDLVFCDDGGDASARILRLPATGRPQIVGFDEVPGAPSCST
jgi:type IV fimbrial biogenesis protein FimT